MNALNFLVIFVCALLILLDTPVRAEAPVENQRVCKTEDLSGGTWKMVQFHETPSFREAQWIKTIPYHYLAFYPDHYYAYLATQNEVQTPSALQKAMTWSQNGKHRLQYTLDDKGVLDLYLDKKLNYRYRCFAIKATQNGYQKGDLVMTGYTKNAKSEVYKLYRRWF